MKKKNTGKAFEQLVTEIYQAFCDHSAQSEGFRKVNVQHDVTLNGKLGNTHQVDVYWEFELAGTTYLTVVEVKDWSTSIKQEHIMAFKAKLDDIPGCPRGIFVSRGGFQKGAKMYAAAHGITLIQISSDNSPSFIVHISSTTTHYDCLTILCDEYWLSMDIKRVEAAKNADMNKPFNEIYLINPLKEKVSIYDLMCMRAVPYYYSPDYECHSIEIPLAGEWYLESGNPHIPWIKIVAFKYVCYNTSCQSTLALARKDFPNYIIFDLMREKKHQYNSFKKTIAIDI